MLKYKYITMVMSSMSMTWHLEHCSSDWVCIMILYIKLATLLCSSNITRAKSNKTCKKIKTWAKSYIILLFFLWQWKYYIQICDDKLHRLWSRYGSRIFFVEIMIHVERCKSLTNFQKMLIFSNRSNHPWVLVLCTDKAYIL
jgi:hypothetical protein